MPQGSLSTIAEPSTITCPDCGGVLSELKDQHPLRFRCQVGHAYSGRTLLLKQEGQVDEAMRVALRIIEERAELLKRMGREARQTGRLSLAESYEARETEYRGYANTLREAAIAKLEALHAAEDSSLSITGRIDKSLELAGGDSD